MTNIVTYCLSGVRVSIIMGVRWGDQHSYLLPVRMRVRTMMDVRWGDQYGYLLSVRVRMGTMMGVRWFTLTSMVTYCLS